MIDINQTIAGWVEDRENMDREIVILKTQGHPSSLYLVGLVKSRLDLDKRISCANSTKAAVAH